MSDRRDEHESHRITSQVEDAEIVPWLRISTATMFCVAANAIERLTTERDEARREVCALEADTAEDQREFARQRGWDCFKEGGK